MTLPAVDIDAEMSLVDASSPRANDSASTAKRLRCHFVRRTRCVLAPIRVRY